MTDVLVTIRLDDGQTEQYQIDYLPTLEAAYAANYGGRPVTAPRAGLKRATRRAPRRRARQNAGKALDSRL